MIGQLSSCLNLVETNRNITENKSRSIPDVDNISFQSVAVHLSKTIFIAPSGEFRHCLIVLAYEGALENIPNVL